MIRIEFMWHILSLFILFSLNACSDNEVETQQTNVLVCEPTELNGSHNRIECEVKINSKREWNAFSEDSWIHCNCLYSKQLVKVVIDSNQSKDERLGSLVVKSGISSVKISVRQDGNPNLKIEPQTDLEGNYQLVWHDEFNESSTGMADDKEWWYETWGPGKFNNELQRYVAGKQGNHKVAEVVDDKLIIRAQKVGNEVISARINTVKSWKYGYFEARIKLPKGKGTWPAFWMMPKKADVWPDCGEIDIMEEVGGNPNFVSSSIHCKSYNHLTGTQKTKERMLKGAEDEFHIYALEWTESAIRTYVDGKEWFVFKNDGTENVDTWPFNKPFYVKFNLAWGGDWGSKYGVDESCLPASYEIDYLRIYQIK